MDIVYVCRDGENPELRYSLRSLKNVPHDKVWIIGGAPHWVSEQEVRVVRRPQMLSPYLSTRDHIRAACMNPDVSDPFQLWNDDFYAMRYIGSLHMYHRGPLSVAVENFGHSRLPWSRGLLETARMVDGLDMETSPKFYDLHLPMVIQKEAMKAALSWASHSRVDAVHVRTLYGNLIGGPGVPHHDVKMLRRTDPFPDGPWLSSGDNTFRPTVEPVLRYTFPDPIKYEGDQ